MPPGARMALRRWLDRIEERAGDAVDLAAAGVRHLLDELHRSAAQAEHELATAVTGETRRRIDSYLSSLPVGDLQREGRGIVVDIVRNTVESWRTSQQARLRAVATAERCCRHRRRPAPSAVYSRLLPRA